MQHCALHRCSICCRADGVIVSTPWMYLSWPHLCLLSDSFLQWQWWNNNSQCWIFLYPSFFSLEDCLFDLSLITVKHHKAFWVLYPMSPCLAHILNHLALKPLFSRWALSRYLCSPCIFLSISRSFDSDKKQRLCNYCFCLFSSVVSFS